jgi:putative endonuclease
MKLMTNYAHGHKAEKVAANYLESKGYKIIALNWRHARAEIDIVAQKKSLLRSQPLVFFEVKYRVNNYQGQGLDYITPKKLAQMKFAAELYVSLNKYVGDYRLGAIELSGLNYEVTSFLQCL